MYNLILFKQSCRAFGLCGKVCAEGETADSLRTTTMYDGCMKAAEERGGRPHFGSVVVFLENLSFSFNVTCYASQWTSLKCL